MLDANEVKKMIKDKDIIYFMEEYGSDVKNISGNLVFKTICHNGIGEGSHKLYYHTDSNMFYCYTGCGSIDIYNIVATVLNLDIKDDFYEIFNFVCSYFNIDKGSKENFKSKQFIDQSMFSHLKKKNKKKEYTILDKNILYKYDNYFYKDWINEGINIETMIEFDIKYDCLDQQIIIPHYDDEYNLVGVRARNLKRESVDNGFKYMPVYYNGEFLRHETGDFLYGLNINKEYIRKTKQVILFESEKSVMMLNSFYGKSPAVALSGSSFHKKQLDLLLKYGVEDIVISLDKEFERVGSFDETHEAKVILDKFHMTCKPYFNVSVIWDVNNLLELKDSPTDKGKEVFEKLYKERIFLQ